ncbi:putative membrane-associated protein [Corynebacterium testudinoris]|uniref:Putative membrane-associated protein n=2 Tax=Corynebacterium testudinoris TaxID=136857 RepID=A0A0G3H710_9CORY|nr:putative membrane-associated protein [Corynebacterium testudinoris]
MLPTYDLWHGPIGEQMSSNPQDERDEQLEVTETSEAVEEPKDSSDFPSFISHPEKADIWLLFALFAMGVFSLSLIPLRAYLLSHPLAYTLLVGGYTSAVVSGANASVGNGLWLVYLLCTVIGAAKFVPIYWFMGKRWGMEFIDMSLQYMPRAHRFFQRAVSSESGKATALTLALIPAGYAPGPVPGNIVNAVAGLFKVRLWIVLAINVASILVINGIMMWLGFRYGDEVLDVVTIVNRYLLWFTLALLGVVFFRVWRQSQRKNAGA